MLLVLATDGRLQKSNSVNLLFGTVIGIGFGKEILRINRFSTAIVLEKSHLVFIAPPLKHGIPFPKTFSNDQE